MLLAKLKKKMLYIKMLWGVPRSIYLSMYCPEYTAIHRSYQVGRERMLSLGLSSPSVTGGSLDPCQDTLFLVP